MPRRKEREVKTEDIINSAIEDGVSAIIEHNPRFDQEYILEHIDKRRLRGKIKEIYRNIEERGERLSDEEKIRYIHGELADYIATGAAFDELGKRLILKSGLEEKAQSGFFKGLFARRELKGEKYLDDVVGAFKGLYALFKTGDYAKRMPEVAEDVATVYNMGFLNPAIEVLEHYGLINRRRYDILKKSIRERTKEGVEKAVSGIEKYAGYQRATASIFGVFGILLLFISGTKITGGVISNLFSNSVTSFIGIFLILISLALFLINFKKLPLGLSKLRIFKN